MRGIFLCLEALLFDLCESLWFHPKLPEHPQPPVQNPRASGCSLLPWLSQAVSAKGLIVLCVLSSACTATRWTIQGLRWWEPLIIHIAFGQKEENAPGASGCHWRDVSSHFGFSFSVPAGAVCVSLLPQLQAVPCSLSKAIVSPVTLGWLCLALGGQLDVQALGRRGAEMLL